MLASDAGGSRAALVLATVLFVVISLAGARCAEAAGTEPAPPPPPAVYTKYLSAVTKIEGDSFRFEWEGRTVTIRLRDADSSDLDPPRRQSAAFLAAQLLEAEPFWIFPCAPLKADTEVRARVWTKKGWLSEILIKSNLAKRRSDVAAVTFPPAETPSAAAPADVPPPPPPAFAAPIQQIVAGDTFEVQREGKTVRLRLYDAACEEGADRAKELAAQTLGTGPVWIFPSSQRKLDASDDLPVRIWTARGWLADVLVAASAARHYPDPDKALEERTEKKAATPAQPSSQPAEEKSGSSTPPKVVWREVPVTVAKSSTHSIETAVFTIPSSEWRLSWDLKRVMQHAAILVNVCYVDPRYSEVKRSMKPAASFTADRGSTLIRHKPGQYYLRIAGAKGLNVKVEYSQKE